MGKRDLHRLRPQDRAVHAKARQALLRQGISVVPELLQVLEGPVEPRQYVPILRILLELADPRSLGAFRHGLHSDNEDIRAISAQGLYRLGAPDALDAAVITLNDSPDPLHADVAPSVQTLAAMGLTVLPSVLPMLESYDPSTRQHAQKVLEQVTFNPVAGRTNSHSGQALEEWQDLWERNGNYQWTAALAQRAEAIQRWQSWLASLRDQTTNND